LSAEVETEARVILPPKMQETFAGTQSFKIEAGKSDLEREKADRFIETLKLTKGK